MADSNNRTSVLVKTQLPQYVREHHDLFVQFVEHYYKFLEQDGKTLYTSKNFSRFLDVDIIKEDILTEAHSHEEDERYHQILDQLYSTYLHFLPTEIIADKNLILKKAKDFYRARGAEKSVEFLIRALYGKEATLYYPKLDILKSSDGKWNIQKTLKLTDIIVETVEAGNVYLTDPVYSNITTTHFSNTCNLTLSTDALQTLVNYVTLNHRAANSNIMFYVGATLNIAGNIANVAYYSLDSNVAYLDTYIPGNQSDVSFNFEITKNTYTTTVAGKHLFVGSQVIGATSNASATVEDLNLFYENGELINELSISRLFKNFRNGERVYSFVTDNGLVKRVSANLFSGTINSYEIINGGSGYREGTLVPLKPAGLGGEIIISKVTKGSINFIIINGAGSGFQINDPVLFYADAGSGAEGIVASVDTSGIVHPNSYNIISTIIADAADYTLDQLIYPNLNSGNVNTSIANSMSYWTYANTGPLTLCLVTSPGQGYTSQPRVDVSSNTVIRSLGILGRMEIIDGGHDYAVNDVINFINPIGAFGAGANARVATIDANGKITRVEWVEEPGQIIGGSGYDPIKLPRAVVVSGTGNGANIIVTSVLGAGASLQSVGETAGVIKELTITKRGYNYQEPPILDFTSIEEGFGANANCTIFAGIYTYPGYFINDDGLVSSFNFLQDRDYYQNYSYVIRTEKSFNKYEKYIKDLTHPIGAKVFGEFTLRVPGISNTQVNIPQSISLNKLKNSSYVVNDYQECEYLPRTVGMSLVPYVIPSSFEIDNIGYDSVFTGNNDTIVIPNSRDYKTGDNVYVIFHDSNETLERMPNATYTVKQSNSDYFMVSPAASVNAVTGNVTVFNPIMQINCYRHDFDVGDIVLCDFDDGGPLANGEVVRNHYSIRKVGIDKFYIEHPNVSHLVANSGYLNVHSKLITITTESEHGYEEGEKVYIKFTDGDIANTTNGLYTISDVIDANTMNVQVSFFTMNVGSGSIHTKDLYIHYNGFTDEHPLTNTVYNLFFDNDPSYSQSGVYTVNRTEIPDTFFIQVANVVTTEGNTRVYLESTLYDTVTFNRTDHGFEEGNTVAVQFNGGNVSNNVYKVVSVIDANSYTITGVGVYVGEDTLMTGTASVGLYK